MINIKIVDWNLKIKFWKDWVFSMCKVKCSNMLYISCGKLALVRLSLLKVLLQLFFFVQVCTNHTKFSDIWSVVVYLQVFQGSCSGDEPSSGPGHPQWVTQLVCIRCRHSERARGLSCLNFCLFCGRGRRLVKGDHSPKPINTLKRSPLALLYFHVDRPLSLTFPWDIAFWVSWAYLSLNYDWHCLGKESRCKNSDPGLSVW